MVRFRIAIALAGALLASGAAWAGDGAVPFSPARFRHELARPVMLQDHRIEALDDPFESVNRRLHAFNRFLYHQVFDPAADLFESAAPDGVRLGLRNAFANLREPITAGSAAMMAEWGDAATASARFGVNSTLGVLGIFDPAAAMGMPRRTRTLDEAFCRWGLSPGPYFVMPVFGPSTIRGTAARLATIAAQYAALGALVIPYRVGDTLVQYVDVRDRMRLVEQMSLDDYAAFLAVYQQVTRLHCGAQTPLEQELFAR
ncbi:MAG: VacJ family lipoprotein [Alphaproteobacteria bacterium]|nr:VacJ family lipoprotein [Alphaproteobacteria bacterium]